MIAAQIGLALTAVLFLVGPLSPRPRDATEQAGRSTINTQDAQTQERETTNQPAMQKQLVEQPPNSTAKSKQETADTEANDAARERWWSVQTWTMRGAVFGAGGAVFVGFLTVLVLIATIWVGWTVQHRTYRPWVFPDMMKIGPIEADKPVPISFRLVNHGPTPALKVNLTIDWFVRDVGSPSQFKIDPIYPPERTKFYPFLTVPPNHGVMRIEDVLPLGEDEKFEMSFKVAQLCVYGKIEYRGVFKGSRATPYPTTFCYFHQLGTNAFLMMGPYNSAS